MQNMGVLKQIWPYEIHGGISLIYQNTTMRVNVAWIKRYCVLCSKTYKTLHICHNFAAVSRQTTRGACICENSILHLIQSYRTFHNVIYNIAYHIGYTTVHSATHDMFIWNVFKTLQKQQNIFRSIWNVYKTKNWLYILIIRIMVLKFKGFYAIIVYGKSRKVIAWHLLDAMPLYENILRFWQLDP